MIQAIYMRGRVIMSLTSVLSLGGSLLRGKLRESQGR